jgi:subtilase family serine protease
MAPGAKIIYYAARSDDASDLDAPLNTIVENRSADLVSCSWGEPEDAGEAANFQAETQIFEQGAAEGITFNFSTGDSGDFTAGTDPSSTPTVNEPADNTFATAVGGTTLGIGAQGQYEWETGWGDMEYPFENGTWGTTGTFEGAGGGGNSSVFLQPSYQQGVVPNALAETDDPQRPHRELPDVAMLASPATPFLVGESTGTVTSAPTANGSGVVYSETGATFGVQEVGGTSLASPLFTGMEALAIQAAGGEPLGYANPDLYALYKSPEFRDIVASPAALGHEPEQVTADASGNPVLLVGDQDTSLRTTPGYDDTTGIGSPTPGFLTWFKDHPNGT